MKKNTINYPKMKRDFIVENKPKMVIKFYIESLKKKESKTLIDLQMQATKDSIMERQQMILPKERD